MPIYDYVCGSCGNVVEVIHGISASGPTVCERCGGSLKRALSAPAIVFKGSGWAKKDARDASRSKAPSSTASPATTDTSAASGDGAAASSTPAGSSGSDASSGSSTAGSTPATTASTSGGSSATTD